MSKHTPGPWSAHICGTIDGGPSELGHETDCSNKGFIAHTVCFGAGDVLLGEVSAYRHEVSDDSGYPRVKDFEENIANARLICAAPDMLAALEQLARLGNGERYGNSDGNMIARAAIAKATGEAA
jgi:hypothetical protein